MTPFYGFPLFLLVTLVFLGFVVVTGRAARRKAHLTSVAGAVISLGITIYFAEKLGESFDLESAGLVKDIHLAMAKTAVCAYLLPLITGPLTIRNPLWLRWHRRVAYLVLLFTVATAVTGTWMLFLSTPLDA